MAVDVALIKAHGILFIVRNSNLLGNRNGGLSIELNKLERGSLIRVSLLSNVLSGLSEVRGCRGGGGLRWSGRERDGRVELE